MNLWGKSYTKAELLRRVGDMRQLADVRPFELADGSERGTRGVRLFNAAGLDMTVLTDRGMSITNLSYRGVPLPMMSAVGSAHPSYSEHAGLGWLRTWPVGFLTPCGLTQAGPPCNDNGQELGLHGRAAAIAARNVSYGNDWQGDDFLLWAEGTLAEVATYGDHVTMKRRLWMNLSEARFWIEDQVQNHGYAPAPHMLLQHFNLGFPLVDATTRLALPPHTTEPRTEIARGGLEQCLEFQQPTAGYQEQVFFHDLETDAQGKVEVSLSNPAFDNGRGLSVTWRYAKSEYPILVEWKMMGEGMYVVGVEPSNSYIRGRVEERQAGTLVTLQPQEKRTYTIEVELK
jgi:hypothetical protein